MNDLPPLRDVINRYDLGARKSLGQHFLLDLNLCARIARTAGKLNDTNIIEIGPGPGGLTRALLDAGAAAALAGQEAAARAKLAAAGARAGAVRVDHAHARAACAQKYKKQHSQPL